MQLIGEGFGSRVYSTQDNRILRVAKNAATQQKHRKEQQLFKFLEGRIQSIKIPQPDAYIEPSDEYPFGAIGYPRIDGYPLQPEHITQELQELLAQQIAEFIYELHSIPVQEIEKHIRLPSYIPSSGDLQDMWSRVSAYLSQNDAQAYPVLERAFEHMTDYLETHPPEKTLVHGDLWYENMIFDGQRIVGIIDFEAASLGPAIVDFMTQTYVSDGFRQAVVAESQKYSPVQYGKALASYLMFLRELTGLDYGIQTKDVDEDSLDKLTRAAAKIKS